MTDLGLALGGGGSKGAFELGAWEAFREIGIEFKAIVGTSIGSINGAFMASDNFEGAVHLWENLQMEQCLEFTENHTLKSTDLLSFKNADILVREMIRQHELNTAPLRALLKYYIQEEHVRSSRIGYGLMTTKMPRMQAEPRWIHDIPEGQLVDFMMASSGLPGLKKVKIDGTRFADGGFVDNVPISMLKDQGFRRIIAIDLSDHSILKSPLIDNIELTFIHDRQDLGGTFDITADVLIRNRRLGYLDTLKAFGRLGGEYYTFEPQEYRQLLKQFGGKTLRGLEQAALIYEVDRQVLYSAKSFLDLLRQRRQAIELDYQKMRHALQIEHKAAAIKAGQLSVLDLLPPMRLAFLMELTAKARENGSLLKTPMKLFRNVDQAAEALIILNSN